MLPRGDVPAPNGMRPVARVVRPVPPDPTTRVPDMVMVPEAVTGELEMENPVLPPESATEVTVPPSADETAELTQAEPFQSKTWLSSGLET